MERGPTTDRRLGEREWPDAKHKPSKEVRDQGIVSAENRAIWAVFARVKYWAARKGPREPGQRPADLTRAAETLRDALEMAWRAGFKGEELADELYRIVR